VKKPIENISKYMGMILMSFLFVLVISLSDKSANSLHPTENHAVTVTTGDYSNKLAVIDVFQSEYSKPDGVALSLKFVFSDRFFSLRTKVFNNQVEHSFKTQKEYRNRVRSTYLFCFLYRKSPSPTDEIPILG